MTIKDKDRTLKRKSFGTRSKSVVPRQDNAGRIVRVASPQPQSASERDAYAKPEERQDRVIRQRGRILEERAPSKSQQAVPPESPQPDADPAAVGKRSVKKVEERPFVYVCALLLTTFGCLAGVWHGNRIFAPEMYHSSGPIAFAEAFSRGQNFATFDLNINIREMRNEQISRFKKAPEVAVLGASHWQEAHVELLPEMDFYNAHVHRDYYEDMPAVVEMFLRHDKLPRKMIIAIRDRLFTPVADRTDFLWLPGIPYYQAMAKRLGMVPHAYWETMPVQRWRELASSRMLYSNALRWYKAPLKPHATSKDSFEKLDVLLPGGSIHWSGEHARFFTAERSERLAKEFAAENFASPPKIDPKGVETIDRLLAFLKEKNVEVALVHPPFNPIYYDRVKHGAYRTGLAKIEKITQDFGKKYGFKVFGSFDPAVVGCTANMYIDAEHSKPECLGKVLKQYSKIQAANNTAIERTAPASKFTDFEQELPMAPIGLVAGANGTSTPDLSIVVSRNDGVLPAVKSPSIVQRVVAFKQKPGLPPLPVHNPFLVHTSDCRPRGPLRRHSNLFAPSHEPKRLPLRVTSIAHRNTERFR